MYNYTNTALALLVKMHLLNEGTAKHLSEKMGSNIHPARFDDAMYMVGDVLSDAEKKGKKFLIEPWKPEISAIDKHVQQLETRVGTLEKELEAQSKLIAQQVVKSVKIKSQPKKLTPVM